jgi:hypothetical protein
MTYSQKTGCIFPWALAMWLVVSGVLRTVTGVIGVNLDVWSCTKVMWLYAMLI